MEHNFVWSDPSRFLKEKKQTQKTNLPVGSSLWRSGNFWFMWRSWLGSSAFKIGHQHSYLCKYDLVQSYVGDGSLWLVRLTSFLTSMVSDVKLIMAGVFTPAVLNEGDFAPSGTSVNLWRHILSQLRVYYWHLVGRSQRCCSISYSAKDSTL